ncbi:hypothetical protein UFOVP731_23 [uncultured Caudovirales phage]|uniref:Uncharacterized protein n=1 Tax=uncultured Caudovirales phage TaxID=2100421 RepID=A0A6J5NNF5_9CAUD|nr:hypothetical protein UFOVP731_23 [uncultured Caudovirales phage]
MDFIQAARDLGIPVAALIAIGIGLWRIIEWLGKEVIIPLKDRHLAFLDSLSITLATLADTQTNMVSAQQDIMREMEAISRVLETKRNGVEK